jgi:23S rRNA (uridine2552-2'-O)-methyltransferase
LLQAKIAVAKVSALCYKLVVISRPSKSRIPSRDHYFHKAKAENYPARSVYKLQELDQRFRLLAPGQRVLDLGAAPGSWSKYAAARVGARGRVLAVDLNPPAQDLKGVTWLQGDVADLAPESLMDQGERFDLVLSDLAPQTTGHKEVDAARSQALARTALALALRLLKPGGAAVVKVFMGPDFPGLLAEVKTKFRRSRCVKPQASLKESKETYLLAWEPIS